MLVQCLGGNFISVENQKQTRIIPCFLFKCCSIYKCDRLPFLLLWLCSGWFSGTDIHILHATLSTESHQIKSFLACAFDTHAHTHSLTHMKMKFLSLSLTYLSPSRTHTHTHNRMHDSLLSDCYSVIAHLIQLNSINKSYAYRFSVRFHSVSLLFVFFFCLVALLSRKLECKQKTFRKLLLSVCMF